MASETPQFEASSVPPPSAPGVEGVQISTAQRARLLTRLVLGTGVSDQDGQPTAAAFEAAEMVHTCVGMIVSADPNVSAEGVVALETMVPILGRLRRSEAMTPDDAGHLAIQLDLLARDRISGEIPEAPGLAGAYQGAAILRALAKIAPGQRTPSLMNSLAWATQEYPQALGSGLLCDVLDPRQPGSLTVMQTSMLTAAMMPRPSTPPRAIVAAAITRMSGGSVPTTDESNEWTRALAQRTDVQGEIFAASVLQHPGLSANEAGRLVAAMARRDSGRADERMQTAIEYTLDSLRTRLGHGNDQSINPGNIAAAIIETSDPAKQLATLFSTRTLNSAAGRGDEGADQIAYAMLQAGIVEPLHLSSPEAAIAATAANLTPESRDPDEHLEPLTLSEQIARRLASGLARVTATVGDAAQWAREIGQKWTRLSPGLMRTRALSALTLAFELLADGRLPFSRPDLLNRLLRRAAHPEIADQGMDVHQAEFEGTLDRVAAAPFALPIGVGAEPAMLNVEFVPGWRCGVSMDELERARRQPEWQLSQATNWLDPNSVAVLADGESCGWIKPDPATNTITTHVKPVPGCDRDESKQHEARAMGAVLSAVALSVAVDSRMAVEGERLAVSYASTTTHRLREAHSAMSQLEPRIKELTGQTFIGAVHRHRQGAYNAKPWKGELYRMLELYDEAQQTCGDVDFGYVEEFPTLAETGCLYEARLRYQNAFEFDFHGTGRGVDSTYFKLVSTAKAVGRDAVILRNTTDPGDPSGEHLTDIYVVFDASAITITARLTGEVAEEMIRQHRQQTLGEDRGRNRQRRRVLASGDEGRAIFYSA